MKCQFKVGEDICSISKTRHVGLEHAFEPKPGLPKAVYQLRVFGGRSQPAILKGTLDDVRMVYRMLEGEYPTRATFGIFYRDKEVKLGPDQPQETKHEPASHPPPSGIPQP